MRLGDWKGIRHGQGEPVELYELGSDLGERRNVASQHLDIVRRIESNMESASVPSERYRVGALYEGKPIWKASDHW